MAEFENVFLYNLDDLAKISAENRCARQAEIVRCQEILTQRAEALWLQAVQLLQVSHRPEVISRAIEPAFGMNSWLGVGAALCRD